MIEQLSFLPETQEERFERRLKQIEDRMEKVRKSLYARNGELMKLYLEQKSRGDVLEAALCRCGLQIGITNNPITFYRIEEK